MTHSNIVTDENLNLNVAHDLKILQHVLKDKDAEEEFISVRESCINMVNEVQLDNICWESYYLIFNFSF